MNNETIVNYHLKSKSTLMNYLIKDEPSGAYLFRGPKGVGKNIFALFLASKLLDNPEKIDKEIHPDLLILPNDKNKILVEDTEKMEKWALNRPFESNKKIIIIYEAHLMSTVVQNKILKLLEEPPEYLLIFLVSSSPGQLLATVRSRCIDINFDLLPEDFLIESLKENVTNQDLIKFSLYLLNGSMDKIEFYTDKNLNEIIELTSVIVNQNTNDLETLLSKVEKITKEKSFNSKFFLSILIGAISYALIEKNIESRSQSGIFKEIILKKASNLNLISLVSKLTYLGYDLQWSNFNFKINFESILLDFIMENNESFKVA
tara:strand:- start:4725 stop:5678 length:954 start_codon:yes stop_codon:yes gene_type:complete